jgi:hypothetical protein
MCKQFIRNLGLLTFFSLTGNVYGDMGAISGQIRIKLIDSLICYVHAFQIDGIGEGRVYISGIDTVFKYTIDSLPQGRYYVEVITNMFEHEFYSDAQNINDATPVFVTTGTTVENINFTLNKLDFEHCITGRIVYDNLKPIPFSTVIAVPVGEEKIARITVSDSGGNYILADLDTLKEYYIFVSAFPYISEFYSSIYDSVYKWEDAELVKANSNDIDFDLDPARCYGVGGVSGNISTNKKSSIEGCVVYVLDGVNVVSSNITNAIGNYFISNLEPDTYTVRVSRPPYNTEDYPNPVAVNNDTIYNIDMTLESGVEETFGNEVIFSISQPIPAVARRSISVRYSFPYKVSGFLEIYNITGRLVKSISIPSGRGKIIWNLTNNRGESVSNGVYFLKFRVSKSEKTLKITVIR